MLVLLPNHVLQCTRNTQSISALEIQTMVKTGSMIKRYGIPIDSVAMMAQESIFVPLQIDNENSIKIINQEKAR